MFGQLNYSELWQNFIDGWKKVYKTSFWQAVIAGFLQVIPVTLFVAALSRHMQIVNDQQIIVTNRQGFTAALLVGLPLLIIISSLLQLAQIRLVLEGVRGKKSALDEVLTYAWKRLWLIVKLALMGLGLLLAALIVIALGQSIAAILGFLALLAVMTGGIYLAISLAFLYFIIMDGRTPKAVDAIKQAFGVSAGHKTTIVFAMLMALGVLLATNFIFTNLLALFLDRSQGADFINNLLLIPVNIFVIAGFAQLYLKIKNHSK